MTPDEIGKLALAFAGGIALAVLYFGGLWLTVRRVPKLRSPHLWTLGSFLLRLAVIVVAVVLIARIHWRYAAAAMAGFILLRLVLVRRMRPTPPARGPLGLTAKPDEDG